jgi:hypothetical protein
MSLASLFFGFGLLLIGAYFVGQPWWRRSAGGVDAPMAEGPHRIRLSGLEMQRDAAYTALTELELDHQVGKVNDSDYADVRRQLMAEAVRTLQQMDAADDQIENAIESAVRQRRSAMPGVAASSNERGAVLCPACGKRLAADARFCSDCGTSLTLTCPACGLSVGGTDLFCGRCGAALASTAVG